MSVLQAVILAIIEGITEFLPVSSTGHMVLAEAGMKMQPTSFLKIFTIAIQLGAIFSVIVLYFKSFFKSMDFYYKLVFAFIPSALLGFLLGDWIDEQLENPIGVAAALLVGGIFFLFIDRIFKNQHIKNSENVDYLSAVKIGIFQCIALFPGVSRSGATIIGGMSQKLTRQAAAEFSFFLAVPTMFAATLHSLILKRWDVDGGLKLKGYEIIKETPDSLMLLLIGSAVAFVVGIIAIKSLIAFLSKYGFRLFGWYRIILGAALIFIHFFVVELKFEDGKKAAAEHTIDRIEPLK